MWTKWAEMKKSRKDAIASLQNIPALMRVRFLRTKLGQMKRLITKRLAWEGPKLRELKDLLDLSYKRSLKPHVRNFQTEKVVSNSSSSRGPPPDAPTWATSTTARGRH